MIDTLKDIEDLEKVIKLLAPGSSNDIQNKQAILKILNNMLDYKLTEFKQFEDTMAPTDFGMSKMNFDSNSEDKFEPVEFNLAKKS